MSVVSKDKITEIFCSVDDFYKDYSQTIKENKCLPCGDGIKHRNRLHEMSESEIITILLMYHFGSFKNFKHYYLMHIGLL